MSKYEDKLKSLLGERETIISEMNEIRKAFDVRQQRLIEIAGSIQTLQELLSEEEEESKENNEENTTENK